MKNKSTRTKTTLAKSLAWNILVNIASSSFLYKCPLVNWVNHVLFLKVTIWPTCSAKTTPNENNTGTPPVRPVWFGMKGIIPRKILLSIFCILHCILKSHFCAPEEDKKSYVCTQCFWNPVICFFLLFIYRKI